MFTLNACLESDDYVDKGQKPDNLKQISRKHLSIEDIRQLSPIFEKISDLNQNLYGKNQDESFFVSMNEVLFVTDGTMNSYTFPVIENGQPSNMNILINDDGQNITTSLIEYNLADDELQQIMNGEIIDTTTNAFLYPLNNDQVEITSKDHSGNNNPCLIEFRVVDTEPCECHETHAPGGCTHPIRIVELISLDCTGGGGGSDSSGTPPPSGPSSPPAVHTPSGPGSPGGTYSGPSESDGAPAGYTGFVIGDGGTGNQEDVDAINQITQEMDAAFGVGNWNFDNHRNKTTLNFSSVDEIISFLDDGNHISYYEVETDDVPNQNQPTKLTKFKIHFQYTPFTLELIVKSKLKTRTNDYEIIEISSKLRPFEFATKYEIIGYEDSIENNIVTINVHGEMRYGLDIIGLDATIPETMNFQIQLNITTGRATSLSTLSNNFFD